MGPPSLFRLWWGGLLLVSLLLTSLARLPGGLGGLLGLILLFGLVLEPD